MKSPEKVRIQERGWPGHHILARRCLFHRNTLVTYREKRIVVSTVGLLQSTTIPHGFDEISAGRFFETLAFHANSDDTRYYDADFSREVSFNSPCYITEVDADDKANEMHNNVVREIAGALRSGLSTIDA